MIGFISAVLGKTGTKLDIYGKFLSENDKVRTITIQFPEIRFKKIGCETPMNA